MDKSLYLLAENFDSLCQYLENILPHGSGIDCKWTFDYQKNGKVIARNSYHCMDDNGFYCGYADFTVKFHLYKALTAFDLQFNGVRSQRLNKKKMLRDYLEDVIYHTLPWNRSIYDCLIKE